MKITHEGKDYDLDVERSIQLGVLKPSNLPENYCPQSGDFFTRRGNEDFNKLFLFIDYSGRCHIAGMCNDLRCYSNVYENRQEFLEKCINRSHWVFRCNLNNKIAELFQEAEKQP